MSKPRIVLLGKLPPPYIGPAIATQILLSSSLKDDFELIHFNTTLNESVGEMGKFGWRKLIRSFSSARKLFRLAKREKAELALVPISQTTVGFIKDSLYILALRWAAVPVLVQLRGSNFRTWYQDVPILVKWWVQFCLKKTEGVVVLGHKLKTVFADFFPPERIYVAPNGADYPHLFGKPSMPTDRLKVLYLSNFLPGKGFDLILEAIALRTELREKISLIAYGAWDDAAFQQKCLRIISEGNLKNVTIGDPISGNEKWKVFNDANVFVFVPRHPEGHPWAIVEAMAAALPVISTDRGAITESVIDGQNGFIVNAEDPGQLAQKLLYFCTHPEAVTAFGADSAEKYRQHYTAERMAGRYHQIFNTVLKQCVE